MDAVVIAQLEQLPKPPQPDPSDRQRGDTDRPPSRSLKCLKGEAVVGQQKTLTTVFFGDGQRGDKFLVMGIDPTAAHLVDTAQTQRPATPVSAGSPEIAGRRSRTAGVLPAVSGRRGHHVVTRRVRRVRPRPYATVKQLKPKLNQDQLLAWIKDPNVPPSRKRLYFTMLGVCGDAQDDLPCSSSDCAAPTRNPVGTRCADRLLPHLARSRRRAA